MDAAVGSPQRGHAAALVSDDEMAPRKLARRVNDLGGVDRIE